MPPMSGQPSLCPHTDRRANPREGCPHPRRAQVLPTPRSAPVTRSATGHRRDQNPERTLVCARLARRRRAITHVSADMADWTARVVAARAPNALRSADPSHVVAWGVEALDIEPRATGDAHHIARSRFARWKNPGDLSGRQRHQLDWDHQDQPAARARLPPQKGLRDVFAVKATTANTRSTDGSTGRAALLAGAGRRVGRNVSFVSSGGITIDRARAFLANRYGRRARAVAELRGGYWSSAFSFRLDGRDFVARFGRWREDFEKTRRRCGSPVPISRYRESLR
jgi:Transposase